MKITTDNVAKVLASIQELSSKQVLVGIPATMAERDDGSPVNNAQRGYIHEYGAPAANIPPRPFLVPGVASQEEGINAHLKKAAQAAMKGDDEKVDNSLSAAGQLAEAGALREINSGNFEELKKSTLAARRKRGRTGIKPLIDTGELRNSITHVIRKKE